MNTTWIHEYIKIIWIRENLCQNLYNTLNTNTTWIHELLNLSITMYLQCGISTQFCHARLIHHQDENDHEHGRIFE